MGCVYSFTPPLADDRNTIAPAAVVAAGARIGFPAIISVVGAMVGVAPAFASCTSRRQKVEQTKGTPHCFAVDATAITSAHFCALMHS